MSLGGILRSKARLIVTALASLAIVAATLGYGLQWAGAQAATLDHVTITPSTATVSAGSTQQFTAQAQDVNNAAITSGVTYAWAVINGGGTIDANALFTAGASAGSFVNTVQVTATQSGTTKTATASVTVMVPGPLDHVNITPPTSATLNTGATRQFAAQAYDAAGLAIPGLPYTWAVVNGGGSITTGGLFTAGASAGSFPNTVQVTTTQGSATAVAAVSITVVVASALDHVTVTPSSATLGMGATQQFVAQGYDASNTAIAGLTYSWAVVNGGGSITTAGLFTAGSTAGAYANTIQASATLNGVTRTGLASVTVTASPTAQPGSAMQFNRGLLESLFRSVLGKVGFDGFLQVEAKVLDKNGQPQDIVAAAGKIATIGQGSLSVTLNGGTASQSYTVTGQTQFIPKSQHGQQGLAGFQVGDKVVVVTVNGNLALVAAVHPATKQGTPPAKHKDDDQDDDDGHGNGQGHGKKDSNQMPPGLAKKDSIPGRGNPHRQGQDD